MTYIYIYIKVYSHKFKVDAMWQLTQLTSCK